MTATNHTLTGALIVALIDKPLIALPLAFLSHFVLDGLPHFGWEIKRKSFFLILAADMAIAASLLLTMIILQLPNWQWLVAGGILGASPDLLWLYYLVLERMGHKKEYNLFARFASKIQWSESHIGIVYEAIWLVATFYVFVNATV